MRDQPVGEQVTEQDPDHPEGEVELGGELGDRDRLLGDRQDRVVLGLQVERPAAASGDTVATTNATRSNSPPERGDPAAGHRVRADHRTGVVVEPVVRSRAPQPASPASAGTAQRPGR